MVSENTENPTDTYLAGAACHGTRLNPRLQTKNELCRTHQNKLEN